VLAGKKKEIKLIFCWELIVRTINPKSEKTRSVEKSIKEA